MNAKDEWRLEMDRMLGIFERESESSLRKISRRFELLDRPFNDEFRQYFLKMSTQKLDMSFTKIEIERWDKIQAKNSQIELDLERDHRNDRDYISTYGTSTGNNEAQLTENDDIHLIVNRENVVEIANSDDEIDDVQSGIPNVNQNEKTIEKNDVEESVSVAGRSMEMQTPFKLMEVRIQLDRCDSYQGKGTAAIDSTSRNVGGSNGFPDVKDEFKSIAMIKAPTQSEFMNGRESIPFVTFDPNLENHHSSTENGGTKQQSSSLTISVDHSKRIGGKRFKCEHCESSFQFKSKLKQHQPIHANGKLIGVEADSNGLYHCIHCIRRFTNVHHLSKHMKVHSDNQYLYDCARCMEQFNQKVDKDRHERRCKGCYFECHLCKVYVTKLKIDMRRHMRTHSGAKPFRCMVCNSVFQTRSNLRLHLNTVHSRIGS